MSRIASSISIPNQLLNKYSQRAADPSTSLDMPFVCIVCGNRHENGEILYPRLPGKSFVCRDCYSDLEETFHALARDKCHEEVTCRHCNGTGKTTIKDINFWKNYLERKWKEDTIEKIKASP